MTRKETLERVADELRCNVDNHFDVALPKTEYLLHLNITINGDRKLSTTDVMNLLATMSTKLDDGTTIKCEYAHHEAI